jgi:hypothetical protein
MPIKNPLETYEMVSMPIKNPLETYEMEHRRAEQLASNCRWLIGITDGIWQELCQDKIGTWQQRAEYALEAAKEIGLKDRQRKSNVLRKEFKVLEKRAEKRAIKVIETIEKAHKQAGKSKLIFKRSKA